MQQRARSRIKRHKRLRKKIEGTGDRLRMSVFKSAKHISAQLIDDSVGKTLLSVSTQDKDQKDLKRKSTCEGAKRIGELIAEKAKAKGINQVVFDRGGFIYHGRIKALAEAAREKGLKF